MESSITRFSKQHKRFNTSSTCKVSRSSLYKGGKDYLPSLQQGKHIPRGMGTLSQRYQIERSNRLLCNRISEIATKPFSTQTKPPPKAEPKLTKQKSYLSELKLNKENINLAKRISNQKSHYSFRSRPFPQSIKTNPVVGESDGNEVLYNRCRAIGQEYYYITIYYTEGTFATEVENIDQSDKYLIELPKHLGKSMLESVFKNDINLLVSSIRVDKPNKLCQIESNCPSNALPQSQHCPDRQQL